MSEEEEPLPAPQQGHDGELLLYDYFKHLTTLALLTLGGVLTLAQMADPADVKPWLMIVILVMVAAAGVCSFGGASEIVRARYTAQARLKSLNFYRVAAPSLLAFGVGMFLAQFVDSLD